MNKSFSRKLTYIIGSRKKINAKSKSLEDIIYKTEKTTKDTTESVAM
jgi:hypothetical protein